MKYINLFIGLKLKQKQNQKNRFLRSICFFLCCYCIRKYEMRVIYNNNSILINQNYVLMTKKKE